MLKVRVIPTLLWKDLGLVKGQSFDSWRRVGTVLPAIKVYNARDVDELILLDITATAQQREPDYEAIESLVLESFVPLTFGGGLRSLEMIRNVLKAGADKVALNSVAYNKPKLITEAATSFGSQCIVASIDFRRESDGRLQCYSSAGQNATGIELEAWAKEVEARGAGEILLTSIDRDGTMLGYDLEALERVTRAVTIPVIASGGAGTYADFYHAIDCGASAVAAAAIFHFTEQTPLAAKTYLGSKGIPVRKSQRSAKLAQTAPPDEKGLRP